MDADPEQIVRAAQEHRRAGRLAESEALCRSLLERHPTHVAAYLELAACLRGQGRVEEGLASVRAAAMQRPTDPRLLLLVGGYLRNIGRRDEAEREFRRAIAMDPTFIDAYNRLGELLHESARLSDVEALFRSALERVPEHPGSLFNLAWCIFVQGRVAEGCAVMRQAVARAPNWIEAGSRLLFMLLHDPACTPRTLYEEHVKWAARHAERLGRFIVPHPNSRDPERRLRVGYVSPDLRLHSVATFIEPILTCHDRRQFEVYCYADVPDADDVTQRLRSVPDQWRDIAGRSDADVAQMIRDDQIDILIDLAGHTAGPLLRIFARKPAPVQITYLGYPATTGLTTIDYRLTDHRSDPPGHTEAFHTEKLIRLPAAAWCYRPPAEAPADLAPPPFKSNGYITFGCFNVLAKATSMMLDLWARILLASPRSRLLLKTPAFADTPTQQRVLRQFDLAGVDAGRIDLLPRTESWAEHLAFHDRIDIALDCFPYNGTTTTCDALWMGVPVVTLTGEAHVSRVGLSLLEAVGLGELVADSPDEYVRIATSLAGDLERVAELRSGLRRRFIGSPLRDEARFTGDFETALRSAWRAFASLSTPGNQDLPRGSG